MWVNVCVSKYSHSQVTSFRHHLKHNNDFTKLIFAEEHLPHHMRLSLTQRVIRYLFVPICMLAAVCLMHQSHIYREIDSYCARREECYAHCVSTNFPNFDCEPMKLELQFDGNSYTNFFFFPKPLKEDSVLYNTCRGYIQDNYKMPRAGRDRDRSLRAHTCFNSCSSYGDCLTGFDYDNRPTCAHSAGEQGIICVDPYQETCGESYIEENTICLADRICINWRKIVYAIIIANVLQVIFEASMLMALSLSLKPTSLDKIAMNESHEDEHYEQAGNDKAKELDCSLVLNKCVAELIFILLYVVVLGYCVIGVIYQLTVGNFKSVLVEAGIALVADQMKSIATQTVTYWVVVRRLGKFQPTPEFKEGKWNDQAIFSGGVEPSLLESLRLTVKNFVEIETVSSLILYMTIVLMIVIFTELAIQNLIGPKHSFGWYVFYLINYVLLLFFIIEIVLKFFCYGFDYLKEPINLIDSVIVITSFVFHVMEVETKILGLLRVLRLIKVISGMKKVVDEKRERQAHIKAQKKQTQTITSYVERVMDFLEKQHANPDIPKHLREDLQWAIDIISSNKLYMHNFAGFKLQEDRPEVKAWTDLISLKGIPTNRKEMERLKQIEVQDLIDSKGGKKKAVAEKKDAPKDKADPNKGLLEKQKILVRDNLHETFLKLTELQEFDQEMLSQQDELMELLTFDAFTFESLLTNNALAYMTYKLFRQYQLLDTYHISIETMINFMKEAQMAYFKENPYHNVVHVIDTMQGLHFMLTHGNLKKYLKKHDILAVFVACLIQDFEHPGYTNQFVVRTKHPLAIRYSDSSVLENHHIAAGFQVLYLSQGCNLLENLPYDQHKEARKVIIDTVLNTEMSRHFSLLTELKTKLGNNFPTDHLEDRTLILSVALRIASNFKIVRDRSTFFKWMDKMFEEFFKQGDMEKVLELPVSKFTDRENCNKEKAFANYISVVCKPLFVTMMIMVDDSEVSMEIIKDLDRNWKSLEQRIDESATK